MADRTNLDLGFVSLVMSVNGRVRPADLQQIPQANRASVLQAYYQANSASTAMHFEGDVLVSGTGSAAQAVPQAVTPAPAPAPIAAPVAAVSPAVVPEVVAAEPPATPALTAESDYFPVTPSASPESNPFGEAWAADIEDEHAEAFGKVSFLLWLLPILLVVIGGVIAFLIARPKNRKTATALLTTGIVLTIVYAIAAGAALYFLGLVEIPGLPSMGSAPAATQQAAGPRQSNAAPAVSAEYPGWKVLGRVTTTETALPSSAAPDKVRQDTSFSLQSPDGRVTISAWYARSGVTTATLSGKPWMNLDTLYRSTPATSQVAVSLHTQMKKDHPSETLLGAYAVGTPAAGVQRYNVGYSAQVVKGGATVLVHGEHVYAYSATAGWKQTAVASKSGSMWAAAGPIK